MRVTTKLLATAATIAVLLGLNYLFEYGFGDFRINAYYARILNLIGINITLAVSLNLINGLAGQFSIGHAGFMAVGGYSATFVTVYYGRAIAGLFGSSLDDAAGAAVVMTVSLMTGAAAAALAGLAVGIPSLRLRGDYLAIVTLGFSEIIRENEKNVRRASARCKQRADAGAERGTGKCQSSPEDRPACRQRHLQNCVRTCSASVRGSSLNLKCGAPPVGPSAAVSLEKL